MIILLHGKDTYRSYQKMEELIKGYKRKNESGINIKYLENPSFQDLKDESGQIGMFNEKKLFVGKDVLSDKELKEEVSDNLEKLSKSENILILRESEPVKGSLPGRVDDLEKERGLEKEYDKLEGKNLRAWYKKEMKKWDADFARSALNKLVDYVGDDLWRAQNEVKKLALLKKESKVSKEDVTRHVRSDLEVNIFDAIDALGESDKSKAIELLQERIRMGDSPFYLYSMINYQLRNLITITDLKEKGFDKKKRKNKSGMKSFVFKKTERQSKNFSFSQIKKTYRELFSVDLRSKTGEITPETGLVRLISEF